MTLRRSSGDFHGRPTLVADNGTVRLAVLAAGAARIVHLSYDGGPNLLAETPDTGWDTPWGRFTLLGGHRLWRAPQRLPGTDAPESAVTVTETDGGFRLAGPPEPHGETKTVEVTLDADAPRVTVRHELARDPRSAAGSEPWAAWGVTQLRLGGVAVVPLADQQFDGGTTEPNRNLVLWPYTRLDDPRLVLRDDCLLLHGTPSPAVKVGTVSPLGRVGYLLDGVLLRKSFAADWYAAHTDAGCNVQVYGDEGCLELETLGPAVTLAPGDATVHVEEWDLVATGTDPSDVAGLRALVLGG